MSILNNDVTVEGVHNQGAAVSSTISNRNGGGRADRDSIIYHESDTSILRPLTSNPCNHTTAHSITDFRNSNNYESRQLLAVAADSGSHTATLPNEVQHEWPNSDWAPRLIEDQPVLELHQPMLMPSQRY